MLVKREESIVPNLRNPTRFNGGIFSVNSNAVTSELNMKQGQSEDDLKVEL